MTGVRFKYFENEYTKNNKNNTHFSVLPNTEKSMQASRDLLIIPTVHDATPISK